MKCAGWRARELAGREKLALSPEGEGWGEGPVDRRSRTEENENEETDPVETLFSRTKRVKALRVPNDVVLNETEAVLVANLRAPGKELR